MDNNNLDIFGRDTKKVIKYWSHRLWQNGGWIVIFINLFIIWIPAYYLYMTDVPSEYDLKKSEGTIVYKELPKLDTMLGLSNTDGIEYFSCRTDSFSRTKGCFEKSKVILLNGKYGEVYWFEQKMDLFTKQKTLARLMVDGEEKYSFDKFEKFFLRAKKWIFWITIVLSSFGFIVVKAYDKKIGASDK